MVPDGFAGQIHINKALLPQDFPAEFFCCLSVLRQTLSRTTEADRRPIIALFLAYAVQRAREILQLPRLTIFSQVEIPWVPIAGVAGLVGGTLEFMTADANGYASMGTLRVLCHDLCWVDELMKATDGRHALPASDISYLSVVEIDYSSKSEDETSHAEIIGHLKSRLIRTYISSPSHLLLVDFLTVSATRNHVGVLTDGQSWTFYLLSQDHFYRTTVMADTPENTTLVLGMPAFEISNFRTLDVVFCW
jgi:hypothetical protein